MSNKSKCGPLLRFKYVLLQTLLNKFENFEEKGNENHLEPFFIPGWHMLAAAYWYGFDGEIFLLLLNNFVLQRSVLIRPPILTDPHLCIKLFSHIHTTVLSLDPCGGE